MHDKESSLDSTTTAQDSMLSNPRFEDGKSKSDNEEDEHLSPFDLPARPPIQPVRRWSTTDTPNESGLDHNARATSTRVVFGSVERPPARVREFWMFRMRPPDDDEPRDWWFASTAIPLLAATLGPLANVMSIAALVTSWRQNYNPQSPGVDEDAVGFPDPQWCIALNAASLVCGFVGNIFLLFNFTRRIRYIVALPATIILWYIATGILIGITISINKYVPPTENQTYSQGFWHAIIAAVLYLFSSMILMVNMLGYFLGHYPQHFDLSDEQRNLILQTMMFFIWLAGGAAVFSRVCDWEYADALYFCDVTLLTVGFGDFVPTNDAGRGLVFPFSVGGIIILGLMVSSIRRFALELGHDKVVLRHVESRRLKTVGRAVGNSFEAHQKEAELKEAKRKFSERPKISAPFDPQKRTIGFDPDVEKAEASKGPKSLKTLPTFKSSASFKSTGDAPQSPVVRGFQNLKRRASGKVKILILREERDRFNAMRAIQYSTKRFKRYFALSMSVFAFGLVWCVGAVVFWVAEHRDQGFSYFQSLYFCYVSLLTIGYGDLAPKSNAGKPFFIVWSLIAVPTMTILVSDMGDTVVASYKRGTFTLGDWTILPKEGFFREFLEEHPRLMGWLQRKLDERAERKRIRAGFPVGSDEDRQINVPTLEQLADEESLDEHELARKLTLAIRDVADDLKTDHTRKYSYEEWVEFTRLIRFTKYDHDTNVALNAEEDAEGTIEWDWIGEDSPMMADQTECEWVLDRLCESLDRYMRRQVPQHVKERRKSRVDDRFGYSRHGSRQDSSRHNSQADSLPGIEGGRYRRPRVAKSRSSRSKNMSSMGAMRMRQ